MSDSALIPIAARFGRDFATLLVYVEPADDMRAVAEKVAADVVGKRVKRRAAEMAVFHEGRIVPVDTTVAEAGFGRLEPVLVDYV